MLYALDCSGSMPDDGLQKVIAYISKQPDAKKVVFFDHRIEGECEPSALGTFQPISRGGTLIQCVFDYAHEHGFQEVTIISDGWFPREVKRHGVTAHLVLLLNKSNSDEIEDMRRYNIFDRIVEMIV